MAPSDTKFSHITVSTEDEDEFVIQAGAHTPDGQIHANADEVVAEKPVEASVDEDPITAPTEVEQAEQSADKQPDDKDSVQAGKGYRETTAEDLKSTPMPTTQKVVIAVAILFIIAFIVYYLFMRQL